MTDDAATPDARPSQTEARSTRQRARDLFSIPPPIKRLFDRFPLVSLPANDLPLRSPPRGRRPVLYVFSTDDEARQGRPSFNPTCLKWQTFLKCCHVEFDIIASNNHASPSGALPFLLPPTPVSSDHDTPPPVPANKLHKYAQAHGSLPAEPTSMRYEAYQALLDHRIRRAWLYALYLEPGNFEIAQRLYVEPCSSNGLVRAAISRQLRAAASSELCKQGGLIVIDELYREAEDAFKALSTLLDEKAWFFGVDRPSLFDASVFAYTHLILHERMAWQDDRLLQALRGCKNLVGHEHRMASDLYGGAGKAPNAKAS
ncbi:MAG: hypothetical protein M1817_004080 [Caeruleum heppii]|nr:MAG: hypothetical protein M1817_004080 [Caeruleum heppii]